MLPPVKVNQINHLLSNRSLFQKAREDRHARQGTVAQRLLGGLFKGEYMLPVLPCGGAEVERMLSTMSGANAVDFRA